VDAGRPRRKDGYAAFAALAAIRALHEQKVPHARCVVIIEACEESGSFDLPFHIDALAPRIGKPSLVVCLDSGCGNYEQLWSTTSLRGLVGGVLQVDVLSEGVHSGDASGVIPSSFRVIRTLLSRLEDENTGTIKPRDFEVKIPDQRRSQAQATAQALGDAVYGKFPRVAGLLPVSSDLTELSLNRTWRAALSITGVDGIPTLENGGNVLRPGTAIKLSLRIPPTLNAERASTALKYLLESDPPYGAKVRFTPEQAADGWNAPPVVPWLEKALHSASETYFGKPAMYIGEGGTIPFMAMLGERFPDAQFVITGVLGPHSNAHGPNEFLHIPMAKRLTACVANVLVDHANRP
jgi:acetylornithine deacetylase/succinyl-diaminopimelate desuccinylase-like protein